MTCKSQTKRHCYNTSQLTVIMTAIKCGSKYELTCVWPELGIGSRTYKNSVQTTHHINLLQYVKLKYDPIFVMSLSPQAFNSIYRYVILMEVNIQNILWCMANSFWYTLCACYNPLAPHLCTQYTVQWLSGDWPMALGCLDFSASHCSSTEFIFQCQRVVFCDRN